MNLLKQIENEQMAKLSAGKPSAWPDTPSVSIGEPSLERNRLDMIRQPELNAIKPPRLIKAV